MADLKVLGEQAFAKYPKVSHELLALTYGALVAQVVAECETVAEANATLEQMGRKIGVRLVEEFLARSGIGSKCKDFQETCNVIAKVGFKMYLGVAPTVTNWNQEKTECSLIFDELPFADFVELPQPQCSQLSYCSLICGVVEGCLSSLQIEATADFASDVLRGGATNDMRLKLVKFDTDDRFAVNQ